MEIYDPLVGSDLEEQELCEEEQITHHAVIRHATEDDRIISLAIFTEFGLLNEFHLNIPVPPPRLIVAG